MSLREVAEDVYNISLAWSNAYLLKNDNGALLIDTGLQKDRADLLSALASLDVSPPNLHTVLLTHAHCDHAGNAAALVRMSRANGGQARLCLGKEEAPYLAPPRQTYAAGNTRLARRPLSAFLFLAGEILFPVAREPVAGRLSDGDAIEAPGGVLRVVSSPGHTPGHLAYYRERDGLLFSGDAILNIIPIRRKTALSLPIRVLSDDWAETKRSARRLVDLAPRVLLSGHGVALADHTAERLQAWAQTL